MTIKTVRICPEKPEHDLPIEHLNCQAFGPGRFTRTAYRLREGIAPDPELSFVALVEGHGVDGQLAGSVRQTQIAIGDRPALLLGPLVVAPACKNLGIGRELMNRTIHAAAAADHELVLLVGDLPYYARFGFRIAPHGTITLPGPADPDRILVLSLGGREICQYAGTARKFLQKNNTD